MSLLSLFLFCIAAMTAYKLTTRLGRRHFSKLLCIATSGAVVGGFILLNHIMPTTTSSCAAPPNNKQCLHTTGAAYGTLKRNALSIQVQHPLISHVDINYLPSNSPNEDRYSMGALPNDCVSLFAVIDGHKSPHCSEYLKHTLLSYVSLSLTQGGVVKGPLNVYKDGDQVMKAGSGRSCDASGNHDDIPPLLCQGFNDLDKNISEEGLKIVEFIKRGRSIKEEGMLPMLMKAIAGACALVAMVTQNALYIANTGDCRAVMGNYVGGVFEATPLSRDQNVHNEDEVKRVKEAHPNTEEDTVIAYGRLLGTLMPFRSFGDHDLKWSKDTLEYIMPQIVPHYDTPPYLTAEPVITTHPLSPTPTTKGKNNSSGSFMILATDGLWDKLSNQAAVDTVGYSLGYKSTTSNSIFNIFSKKSAPSSECCTEPKNTATELLWKALGGSEESVSEMLSLEPPWRRAYRDDITIIVVHFK